MTVYSYKILFLGLFLITIISNSHAQNIFFASTESRIGNNIKKACFISRKPIHIAEDTVYMYDTVYIETPVYVYDTIYVYDTVYVDYKAGNTKNSTFNFQETEYVHPFISKKHKLFPLQHSEKLHQTDKYEVFRPLRRNYYMKSAEIYFSPLLVKTSIAGNDTFNDYINKRELSESNKTGFNAGIEFAYHIPAFSFHAGVAFTQFKTNVDYNLAFTKTDSTITYQYFNRISFVTDTIDMYYQIVNHDTLTFYVTRQREVPVTDSTKVTKYQTTTEYSSPDILAYQRIEIPVYGLYNYGFDRFTLNLGGGVIAGLNIKSSGKILDNNDIAQLRKLNKLPFAFVDLSILLMAGITYPVTDRYAITTKLYYRRHLTSVFKNNFAIEQKINAVGVRVGAIYRF